jgi:segregation and condensation protein B
VADSKDKFPGDKSAGPNPLSSDGELNPDELAAIERWKALTEGDDLVEKPFEFEAKGENAAFRLNKDRKASPKRVKRSPKQISLDLKVEEEPDFNEKSEGETEQSFDSVDDNSEKSSSLITHLPTGPVAPSSDLEEGQLLMRWDEAINLEAQVESILFASPKPISVAEISELLADDDGQQPDLAVIDNHVQQLQRLYRERNGGFRLEYDKGVGYQFRTVPAAAPLMERMFSSRQRPLSRAAHETLAIIAYRQPCTRADIEFIRGVDAGSIIKNLLERDLVTCVGRKEDSGRPMLFGTTAEFLRVFRVQSLNDLPPLSAFQPASEAMIDAFQKIESPEETIDVEVFIGDDDRDPTLVTQHRIAEFAASEHRFDVREDPSETASQPAQIRRAGGSYDNEGFSRGDGIEDTEMAVGAGNSVTQGSRKDADRRSDRDQRPNRQGTRDED